MKPRASQRTVKLVGITGHNQGSHDSLCAYYAAATLLCALRPEFADAFEASHARQDPLFSHVRRRRGETLEQLVSSWLMSGMELRRVTAALNAACRGDRSTSFRHSLADRSAATLETLCGKVDEGLPSLLAWDSREIGNHTVVVVGYERHARSRSRWLRVLDPIQIQQALEWNQLRAMAMGSLELVVCTHHDGLRPDKVTTYRDKKERLITARTVVERFDPREDRYETALLRA